MEASSQNQGTASPIVLLVRGCGHVPSFKNSKKLVKFGNRPGLITKPEYRKWMDALILDFESALSSALRMRGIATTTGPTALSKIALYLPLDDSRRWIPEHSVRTRLVSKGEEGADITIERIG